MIKSTIRNTIQNTIRNTLGDEAFNMLDLFSGGKRGVWYDPSDLSTMYQDTSIYTNSLITGDNQPVSFMLDKSQGDLVSDVELVTNGTFNNDTNDWSLRYTSDLMDVVNGELVITFNDSFFGDVGQNITLEAGKTYILTGSGRKGTAAKNFVVRIGDGAGGLKQHEITSTNNENFSVIYTAGSISGYVKVVTGGSSTNGTVIVDNISVREVLGTTATQPTSALRPTYRSDPDRLQIDLAEDSLLFDVPTGGIDGYMTIATTDGTASYGVSLPEGQYELGGNYFPSTNSVSGFLLREGDVSQSDLRNIEKYFVSKGAKASYGDVTNFSRFWQNKNITEFPFIDTSSGTNFGYAWWNSKFTNFPTLDTSNGTSFYGAWYNNELTSFPKLNFSSATNFDLAWYSNNNLSDFPAGVFDNCPCTKFAGAFTITNLTQQSIDNILISIASNGTSNGTFTQSGGQAPSSAGEAAIDALVTRGWTVNVTGGYQGKTLPYALFENDENGFWYEMETN